MGEPEKYKPTCTTFQVRGLLSALDMPDTESIEQLSVVSHFHQIFSITFSKADPSKILRRNADIAQSLSHHALPGFLILRIAGHHIPRTKLMNEIAMLKWLSERTSIPVPKVTKYSTSNDNPLGYEYMLLTKSRGVTVSTVYHDLSRTQILHLLDQLTDYLLQLYHQPFSYIGGLRLTTDDQIVPGPPCEETMWMAPDIETCFGGDESFSSLNPTNPDGYVTYTSWIAAYMQCYIHAITVCELFRPWLGEEEVHLLRKFVNFIQEPSHNERYNDIPLILAHRDLHFGQILADVSSLDKAEITAILDWEFAQVVPFPLWRRSFLWNGNFEQPHKKSSQERARLIRLWEQRLKRNEEGRTMLVAEQWKHREQKRIWDVCNYVRCIVEVVPRRKQLDDAKGWWKEVLKALRDLKVL